MVTLASYESSQHCASIVTCLLWEYAFHLRRRVSVVMNLHDPGFLQTSGFSTEFANNTMNNIIQVQCPVLLWVWLQFEYWCVIIPEIQC